MYRFPAVWRIGPASPFLSLVDELETQRAEWGVGPPGSTPVIVWDGSADTGFDGPFPGDSRSTHASATLPVVLIGPGPFGVMRRAAVAHLITPTAAQLWAVVIAVSHGYTVVPRADQPVAEGGTARPTRRPTIEFTERENQVLYLIAAGLPNKAIAAELGIGLGTVKFHLENMMAKLDAQNRAELVMEAAREGLLEV